MRKRMEEFVLNEVSFVDRPAQEHARSTIMKRRKTNPEIELEKAADSFVKRYIDPADGAIDFQVALDNALEQARFASATGWSSGQSDVATITEAMNTSIKSIIGDANLSVAEKALKLRTTVEGFMVKVQDKWPDVQAALAKVLLHDPENDLGKGAEDMDVKELEKKVGELTAQLAELTKSSTATIAERDALKASLATAEAAKAAAETTVELEKARKKMPPDEQEMMDTLEENDKKKAWVALTPEARRAQIAEKRAGDETVVIEGQSIKKSKVGPETFAVLKAQADRITKAEADIAKARELAETASFEKRAGEELTHFGGEVTLKGKVLKAIAGVADAEVQKALGEMLKAGDAALKGAFEKIGGKGGKTETADVAKAKNDFQSKVGDIAKNDKISRNEAMTKARTQHPDLYKQAYPEQAGPAAN